MTGDTSRTTRTPGRDAQRRFSLTAVSRVVHQIAVVLCLSPGVIVRTKAQPTRTRRRHHLRTPLRENEGTFGSAIDQTTEPVVYPLRRRGPALTIPFARDGLLDGEALTPLAGRTEGNGLGPHAACRRARSNRHPRQGPWLLPGVGSVELGRHRGTRFTRICPRGRRGLPENRRTRRGRSRPGTACSPATSEAGAEWWASEHGTP